jgi:hypothetical protein
MMYAGLLPLMLLMSGSSVATCSRPLADATRVKCGGDAVCHFRKLGMGDGFTGCRILQGSALTMQSHDFVMSQRKIGNEGHVIWRQ